MGRLVIYESFSNDAGMEKVMSEMLLLIILYVEV